MNNWAVPYTVSGKVVRSIRKCLGETQEQFARNFEHFASRYSTRHKKTISRRQVIRWESSGVILSWHDVRWVSVLERALSEKNGGDRQRCIATPGVREFAAYLNVTIPLDLAGMSLLPAKVTFHDRKMSHAAKRRRGQR